MSATVIGKSPGVGSPVQKMTVAEYLAFEHAAKTKHEFVKGEVIEMAGASLEHSAIATDTRTTLAINLRGTGCEVYDSDLRVRVAEDDPYYYPDATVVCGMPDRDTDQCLHNPYVIVAVLSESTESADRDTKFRAYRRIPSLRHYILISQVVVRVEHFERLPGNIWALVGEHERLQDTLVLNDLTIRIPVMEIYRRVTPPEP
jgi:Uma2 family endonuclease